MSIDEKSIYLVDGGDYSIYCLGYTQARTVTNDIMRRDPDLELSLDDRGNVVMTKSTLDKILFIASDELPEGDE
jgi:hypothetical protein